METGFIDLHVHSTCSDGTFTPSELVHEARRHSIYAFALTDHDCIDGIREAQEETLRLNSPDAPEVIAGVELSCELDDREIHMVGLYINPDDKVFNDKLNAFRSSRTDRNRLMVDKLQQEAHFAIDYDSQSYQRISGCSHYKGTYCKIPCKSWSCQRYECSIQ